MAKRRLAKILDADGTPGMLHGVDVGDPHHPLAHVRLANGARVHVPFDILAHHDDGGYTMAARWSDFPLATDDALSLPVIAESLSVTVRPAPTRTSRIRRRVVAHTEVVEVPIWRERIEIDHVPVDRFVDHAPAPHRDGDTLIVPCIEEVVVVERRLRVREELHVRVVREQHVHRETVTLRRHEVDHDVVDDDRARNPHSPPKDPEGDHS